MPEDMKQPRIRIILSLTLLLTMLMACGTHTYRHLNLSGDEVFFYFLGMKDYWPDYRPFYERVRSQFAEEERDPHLQMSPAQLANFQSSEFYLGIEPLYFAEYKVARLIWGTVSAIVAPTNTIIGSDQALSDGLGDSVFFMFLTGYVIVCLFVVAVTYHLGNFAKVALIVFMVATFMKESFLRVDVAPFF